MPRNFRPSDLPLIARWYKGATRPPLGTETIVFWEDTANDTAKILMKRSNRTFVFESHEGDSTGTFVLTSDSPTWTGTHLFNNMATFNAGISLGVNGIIQSSVAAGASNIAFDLQSDRTDGYMLKIRNTNGADNDLLALTRSGNYAFGHRPTLTPTQGHVLGFLQEDSNSPAGFPHYVGILSVIVHDDTNETVPVHYGIVGASLITTATGLTPTLVGGVQGQFLSASLNTVSAVSAGAFVAAPFGRTSVQLEPPALNTALAAASTGGGNYALVANFLGYCTAPSGTIGLPATGNRPAIGCTLYAPIQKWPCGTAAGSAQGEAWAIYGDSPDNGLTTTNCPAVTGFMRITYPRRTGGTTPAVHATHLWFEPWPLTSTIKTGAIQGDVVFDNGTSFPAGLYQYTDSFNKLIDIHDFVSYEDDAVFYEDELVLP